MRGKRLWIPGSILKITGLLAAAFIISIILFTNLGTYAWFTGSVSGNARVSAASARDILEYWYIRNDSSGNAIEIVLKKSGTCTYQPVIFFSVDGEAANYVLHINSVRLVTDTEYRIPIEPNINLTQYIALAGRFGGTIKGTINVKHLNEYIDEVKDIKFSKDYLSSRFRQQIDRSGTQTAGMNSLGLARGSAVDGSSDGDGILPYITELISYIAGKVTWSPVRWSNEEDSMSKPEMQKEQDEIVNAVAPGLMDYLDDLHEKNEYLGKNLGEETKKADELGSSLEKLQEDYSRLKDEYNSLSAEMENLKKSLTAQTTPISATTAPETTAPETPATDSTVTDTPAVDVPVTGATETNTPPVTPQEEQPNTGPETGIPNDFSQGLGDKGVESASEPVPAANGSIR